jgi:hypothetical protein
MNPMPPEEKASEREWWLEEEETTAIKTKTNWLKIICAHIIGLQLIFENKPPASRRVQKPNVGRPDPAEPSCAGGFGGWHRFHAKRHRNSGFRRPCFRGAGKGAKSGARKHPTEWAKRKEMAEAEKQAAKPPTLLQTFL